MGVVRAPHPPPTTEREGRDGRTGGLLLDFDDETGVGPGAAVVHLRGGDLAHLGALLQQLGHVVLVLDNKLREVFLHNGGT